ncbi:SDR family oxidoreductase [Kitasatospora sp. NBC_01287]|uniref:SDR family oxidoreductase n=1 Tax=Kitasatospora sp. NBC_01287 TaxID=2903573 RepID=UPI00224CF420|nr:SDR family oxidoreductase [Kitasatospora sp. NBC_01287]MCX4748250.1 SDR family oxidoreductase [Kitasatospora sp. NBC_01287]
MATTGYPELAGRTAVVTGAASGMGEATARLLAAGGARVALLARRADRLAELAEKITAEGGQALAVRVDVGDQAAVDAAAAQVRAAFGQVDLLVNAAGVMLPNPLAAGRLDEWTTMIDTNLTGALRMVHAFRADLVAAAAEGRTADLVNVSSIGAHVAFPNYAVYGATKAALTQLSASLRTEFGPLDVRVTNIEPGLTETELGGHIDNAELADQLTGMLQVIPPLTAADIADLIGWTTSRRRGVNLRQAVILPTRQA